MIKKYYVTGNTAEKFVNFLETNIEDIEKVLVLKHQSHKFKTSVMNNLIKKYDKDYSVEILCSALGNHFLDGIILREKSVAIVSDAIVSAELDGVKEIDLSSTGHSFIKEQLEIKKHTQSAYDNFETGLKVHDDLETIYINEMDFIRADEFAEEFIEELLHLRYLLNFQLTNFT